MLENTISILHLSQKINNKFLISNFSNVELITPSRDWLFASTSTDKCSQHPHDRLVTDRNRLSIAAKRSTMAALVTATLTTESGHRLTADFTLFFESLAPQPASGPFPWRLPQQFQSLLSDCSIKSYSNIWKCDEIVNCLKCRCCRNRGRPGHLTNT